MIDKLRDTAQAVIDTYDSKIFITTLHPYIEALRSALAEPQQCEWRINAKAPEFDLSCGVGSFSEFECPQDWMTFCYGCGKKIKFVTGEIE